MALENWDNKKNSELADYIVAKHHNYLHNTLSELSMLVSKINRVHGPNHEELNQLNSLYHTLKGDLEPHLIREEEELFPLIKAYESNPSAELLDKIKFLIEDLEKEHVDSKEILKQLRAVSENYFIPEDACSTFARTYKELERLEADMLEHIELEDELLFKRW